MEKDAKIFVAGHRGMVGSALVRQLEAAGHRGLLFRGHGELDLRRQAEVEAFFAAERPDYVFLAAAKVGGINANRARRAEFLHENMLIQDNVIWSAFEHGVKKLCFLGSSCIYPRECPQPMREEQLLSGPLEPTNEGYAIAKIAGHKLCKYLGEQHGFKTVSLMPCNLYGANDNFNLETCHVLSALVRRFVEAADNGLGLVTLWGTGAARREFMHVDDMAAATLFLMERRDEPEFINVGSGEDISIRDLATLVAAAAGYQGAIHWDASMPDGMPRKLMDNSKLRQAGFVPSITLEEGVRRSVAEYRALRRVGAQVVC